MKQREQRVNRLQATGQQSNINIGIIDNISLGMPIIINAGNQQQLSTVPMATSGQAVPGTSSQISLGHMVQTQGVEDEDNSDDGCDVDDGIFFLFYAQSILYIIL